MRIRRRRKGEGGEQGRIHGRTVADGWAGAVKKCYGPTDRPTDTARCRVAFSRLQWKGGGQGRKIILLLKDGLTTSILVIFKWGKLEKRRDGDKIQV